jgi:hypothetical protein
VLDLFCSTIVRWGISRLFLYRLTLGRGSRASARLVRDIRRCVACATLFGILPDGIQARPTQWQMAERTGQAHLPTWIAISNKVRRTLNVYCERLWTHLICTFRSYCTNLAFRSRHISTYQIHQIAKKAQREIIF